ncbi:GOLPH3/VPS74 family protein [Streptomyces sp. 061-3]|uniref:GOLPH3/VPS74 family protein n=1 Tax=Streptomyces sp. 061-3 TaxID=2789268 RepID=UPI00397F34D3
MTAPPDFTLPEELLLLALDPLRGTPYCRNRFLQYGVVGAALAELELQGRITEERGRLSVINPLPPHDPLLAAILASFPAPTKRRFSGSTSTYRMVRATGREIEGLYLDHLVAQGALARERRRFLGLFPYYRHPAGPDDWSAPVRERFAAAEAAGFPDPRSRLLAGLASAIGLSHAVTRRGRPGRSAMRALVRPHWASHAVHRNVRQDKNSQNSN